MKKIYFILISLISFSLNANNWAPKGAEWYYDVTFMEPNIDYRIVKCDTTIKYKGVDCQRIKLANCACNTHFCGDLYTFERNDTVFFFNRDIDTFQILYAFNSIKGDKWEIYTKDQDGTIDTIKILVDSTSVFTINNQTLKKLYVTYRYSFNHFFNNGNTFIHSYDRKSEIIEKIGDLGYLINIEDKHTGTCDIDIIGGLRCYNDINLGHYSTGIRDSCTFKYNWLSIPSINNTIDINVYPNPVHDKLKIKCSDFSKISFVLIDTKGMILKIGKEDQIDFSEIKSGMYYLRITIDNKISRVVKVIKSTCPNTVYKP